MLAVVAMLLSACSQPAKEVSIPQIMDQLAKEYGLEEGMLVLTEDDLLELYGIESADVKQFAARLRLESIQADEIVLIEATDGKAAERVKEMLDNRYQSKLNETRDYLPDEFAKIEKCKVMQNGNFVSMIVCAEAEKAVGDYEKALK
jgi:hypothetical protein